MATEKVLIEIEIDNEQAKKNEAELIKLIARERAELVQRRKELKRSGGTSEEAAKRIGELTRSININSKELRRNQNQIKAQDNSNNALKASISSLTAERDNLNRGVAEGAKRYNELTKLINEQTAALKKEEEKVLNFRRNVGNYTNSILEAAKATGLFGVNLGDIERLFNDLRGGVKNVTGAFKTLRGAIIATGIGALIIALTSVVAFLTRTTKGAELLEKVLGAIGGVTNFLIQNFAKLGETIINVFTEPKQAFEDLSKSLRQTAVNIVERLSNLFGSLGVVLKGVFTANEAVIKVGLQATKKAIDDIGEDIEETFDDALESVSDFGEELVKAAKSGFNLAAANIQLRKAIRGATIEAGKAERAAEEARLARDDETRSLEERIKQNDLVGESERKRTEELTKATNARIQLIRNEAAVSGRLTEEQRDEIANLAAELETLQADLAGRLTEVQTEGRNILFENQRAILQADIDTSKARLAVQTEFSDERLTESIRLAAAERDLALLEAEQEITNEEALNARKLLINAEFDAALIALREERDAEFERIDSERTAKEVEEAAKRVEAAQKEEQAKRAALQAEAELGAQIGKSAAERANSEVEASRLILNAIRDEIKARIAQAVAAEIAKVATSVPPFVTGIIAAGATAALITAFDSLIPAFATGGIVKGGIPVSRSNGDNRLITAKVGEVVLNQTQQNRIGKSNLALAGVPGFQRGGIVEGNGSITATQVSMETASKQDVVNAVIAGVSNMPAPVLSYKEFTEFQNNVQLRESRASI